MKLKLAVFDFDGTLFDSMYIWDNVAENYLISVGRRPAPGLREDIRVLSTPQTADYFIDKYNLELSREEIVEGITGMIEDGYLHEAEPKEGAVPFLDELKSAGALLCIASSTDRFLIEAALERCGISGYFSAVFTSPEVGHSKDEPHIYRAAAEAFGASREETLIFEDSFQALETAAGDGFHTVACYDGSEPRQEELKEMCDIYLTGFGDTEAFLQAVLNVR